MHAKSSLCKQGNFPRKEEKFSGEKFLRAAQTDSFASRKTIRSQVEETDSFCGEENRLRPGLALVLFLDLPLARPAPAQAFRVRLTLALPAGEELGPRELARYVLSSEPIHVVAPCSVEFDTDSIHDRFPSSLVRIGVR